MKKKIIFKFVSVNVDTGNVEPLMDYYCSNIFDCIRHMIDMYQHRLRVVEPSNDVYRIMCGNKIIVELRSNLFDLKKIYNTK